MGAELKTYVIYHNTGKSHHLFKMAVTEAVSQ